MNAITLASGRPRSSHRTARGVPAQRCNTRSGADARVDAPRAPRAIRCSVALGLVSKGTHAPILHEGIGREHEGVPAQNRFVGLHAIIGQPEAFLEIPVVDLRLPTVAVVLQDRADTQRRVRTQEVSGMAIPPGPFGNDRYHRVRGSGATDRPQQRVAYVRERVAERTTTDVMRCWPRWVHH